MSVLWSDAGAADKAGEVFPRGLHPRGLKCFLHGFLPIFGRGVDAAAKPGDYFHEDGQILALQSLMHKSVLRTHITWTVIILPLFLSHEVVTIFYLGCSISSVLVLCALIPDSLCLSLSTWSLDWWFVAHAICLYFEVQEDLP